jgi:DNA-binding NarL/FixJ family response regulator
MPHRTRVQVIATDPISRAGAVGVLSLAHELDVRAFEGPSMSRWQPQVAVLAVERVDRTTLIQLRVTRRSGVPVVLVASDIDGFDVLAALEAGTTAMVLRSEATTERLLEVVRMAVSTPDRSAQESYLDLRRPGVPAQRPASRLVRALARSSAVR